MPVSYQIFSSDIGEVLVAGGGFAITHVAIGTDRYQLSSDFRLRYHHASPIDTSGYVREACNAIAAYLSGASKRIDITFQADGTEFERSVWNELCQIPYGETRNCSKIVLALGLTGAHQAVADACAANPLPIVIPCHRIILRKEDFTGLGLPLQAREFLLALEQEAAWSVAL